MRPDIYEAVQGGSEIALREAALDDLVDRVMMGEEYPPRALRPQVNILDILYDAEHDRLIEAVAAAISKETNDLERWEIVERAVRGIVRDFLYESRWVLMRAEELSEELRGD